MQNHYLSTKGITSFLLASAIVLSGLSPSFANSQFHLNANQTDMLQNAQPPGLGRNDMQTPGDAFSNPQEIPGQVDFGVQQATPPPPPKKPFGLQASDEGGGNLQAGQPTMGTMNPQNGVPQQGFPQGQQPQFTPQQADEEALVDWDTWHRRVAAAIYSNYNFLKTRAGYGMRRTPLQCNVSYVVTCQGQIINVQIIGPSMDPVYNTLCMGAINTLSGNFPVLQFPQGTRRQYIEMPATFSENMNGHIGFRTLQGDRETVKTPGHR
ncbi:MAG TPA: hypothetical protein V6C81_19905 [Planktothrix sp.]|jgi:hypothetical protein